MKIDCGCITVIKALVNDGVRNWRYTEALLRHLSVPGARSPSDFASAQLAEGSDFASSQYSTTTREVLNSTRQEIRGVCFALLGSFARRL